VGVLVKVAVLVGVGVHVGSDPGRSQLRPLRCSTESMNSSQTLVSLPSRSASAAPSRS